MAAINSSSERRECGICWTVFDPAEDGFVFSASDLALWMRRASRLETAKIENSPFRSSGQPKASCW